MKKLFKYTALITIALTAIGVAVRAKCRGKKKVTVRINSLQKNQLSPQLLAQKIKSNKKRLLAVGYSDQ